MIKVCHMTSVHNRYDSRILKKECVSLANANYDVTLLVADNKSDENYNGVFITSINFAAKNRLDRIINSKKYMLIKVLEIDADIYHFHDPELIPLGLKLLKLGKKVIYDSHEDYSNDIKLKKKWIPFLLRQLISFLFNKYEKYAIQKFSATISVTPSIINKFKKYSTEVYMITNYPLIDLNLEEMTVVEKDPLVDHVCFAGSIAFPWAHENVIKALNSCGDVRLYLAGPTVEGYLESLRSLSAWESVDYLGTLDQESVFALYKQSFAGVAVEFYNEAYMEGSLGNTKIFEFMRFGLPVILTNYPEWEKIISKWNCGIAVNPNSIDDIKDAIISIRTDTEKAKVMARNAILAVRTEYNWSTQEKILLEIYSNLIENRR